MHLIGNKKGTGKMNANELADKLKLVRYFLSLVDGQVLNDAEAVLRQFGLAESIIKQQELQIEALKAEVKQWEEWKESLNGWSKK
jgi:hypothetical protein